uniref:CHM2A protein n=1 Tax=Macrostomum lignano TaxID=282301 RepID=A0A1I8F9I8_9PLAT
MKKRNRPLPPPLKRRKTKMKKKMKKMRRMKLSPAKPAAAAADDEERLRMRTRDEDEDEDEEEEEQASGEDDGMDTLDKMAADMKKWLAESGVELDAEETEGMLAGSMDVEKEIEDMKSMSLQQIMDRLVSGAARERGY